MKLKSELNFDAAHRLVGYNGSCSFLHGHKWLVEIEVEGNNINDIGILWDFTNCKKIKDKFDHKTILKECDENRGLINTIKNTCGENSIVLLKDNPTAEHLTYIILDLLKFENPNLTFIVRVFESEKSYAEEQK